MPAGMVRPRASQVPALGPAVVAEYFTGGWRASDHGRITLGAVVGPCAGCHLPCVRYGSRGGPLCPTCRIWRPGKPRPVPARITMALDVRDLYGPEVDRACGTWEGNPYGDVDAWEAGVVLPTPDQVEALARLCRMPVDYFTEPVADYERSTVMHVCDRTKRKHGLTIVTSTVDAHGVLHREYHQPSRQPP